ncbi:MAG: phage BR0599 family protein [Rhizomicrobium sp.]
MINWTNTSPTTYFYEGTIAFTSGELEGITANLKASSSTTLTLADQLPVAPQPGDSFDAYPGCNHTTRAGGCATFNNLAHFRGYPNVPPPATAF